MTKILCDRPIIIILEFDFSGFCLFQFCHVYCLLVSYGSTNYISVSEKFKELGSLVTLACNTIISDSLGFKEDVRKL